MRQIYLLKYIIIKTSSTGPSWKNNIIYKWFSQPHKHLRQGKLKTTQLREAINGWLPPLTHQHGMEGQISHSNPSRQDGLSKLGSSIHLYTKLQWMTAVAARVYRTPVEADGSSLNIQWLEFELTMYNILSPATQCRWQQKLIGTKPGNRIHLEFKKLKLTFSSRSPHCITILSDWVLLCNVQKYKFH